MHFFDHSEKIFSLSKTSGLVPYDDVKELLQEFFCYLFLAGIFIESSDIKNNLNSVNDEESLDSDLGMYFSSSYSYEIQNHIFKGLKIRYQALTRHKDTNDFEKFVLGRLNYVFNFSRFRGYQLSGKEIISIAYSRGFENSMLTVAQYVSRMFGRRDFPNDVLVPQIYISKYGNIHLIGFGKDHLYPVSEITLTTPTMPYATDLLDGEIVTPLWAMMSSIDYSKFKDCRFMGNWLVDFLSQLTLASRVPSYRQNISCPRYLASVSASQYMFKDCRDSFVASSYNNIMFSASLDCVSDGSVKILRQSLLLYILDLMMEKFSIRSVRDLFYPNFQMYRITQTTVGRSSASKTPAVLKYALEALDGDDIGDSASDDSTTKDSNSSEDNPDDTSSDDDSKDKSDDTKNETSEDDDTSSQVDRTDGISGADKDTIGIISFDKEGEGINENLLRLAIVSLNDRIQNNNDLDISPENRDKLQYWVNGFIHRTSIKSTIALLKNIGLYKYIPQLIVS